ncbi:hypothetical protein L1987_30179 [Smallanthus sonchifolius]|uniref:Uncharacterized protein n=1 Tax=Smallanthus sonchifolius TaxID=185202 RepID=A0ACB9I3V4_9ASTR|nr:hypothetical protein L1987_30179 [Smallanthus sonchifolius]
MSNGVSEEEKIDDEALKSRGKVEEIKKKPIRRNKYKFGQAHAKKKNTPCVDRPKKRSRVDMEDDSFDLNRFLGLDHHYVDRPNCSPEVLFRRRWETTIHLCKKPLTLILGHTLKIKIRDQSIDNKARSMKMQRRTRSRVLKEVFLYMSKWKRRLPSAV